jgi:hypothetical protein
VERLDRLGARRELVDAREPGVQLERRHCEEQQHSHTRDEVHDRATHDGPGDPVPERVPFHNVTTDPALLDLVAEQREDCGKQRECGQHREDHHERRAHGQ